MRPHAVDVVQVPAITRRTYLQAAGLALVARLTVIANELAPASRKSQGCTIV